MIFCNASEADLDENDEEGTKQNEYFEGDINEDDDKE